jgi:predicted amidohydrolase YtcJ
MKHAYPSALVRIGALALAASAACAAQAPAQLVLRHARIYTANAAHGLAEAVAVSGGRIVYVGSDDGVQGYVGAGTRVEDLGGKLVLPGLVDSHIHASLIVDLDTCDLKSAAKSLAELTAFVRGCIERYRIPAGEWVTVELWNYTSGNIPDPQHPTLRAALDLASTKHPIQLLGNDGHHGAFNSMALARAKNGSGKVVGFSKATLASDFKAYRKLIGVDALGEPNGTVNEDARHLMDTPSWFAMNMAERMKSAGKVTARLNSVGITGIMDAAVPPQLLPFYDELEKSGQLSARVTLAQYYDPDSIRTSGGQPDWERMLAQAKTIRDRYAHDPLIRADRVKLFADGILEGNPYSVPPTLPEDAVLRPYLQPIFKAGKDGRMSVVGYVDTASALCADVRAHPEKFSSADAVAAFTRAHGYHPDQCQISTGQLQHAPEVIMEFVKRFHLAGFPVHIHAISDQAVRTAVDAIEAARKADGVATQHDALAHIQLVNPADVPRIGRDHLYLAFTYSWAIAEPNYDLSVVPFFDKVQGNDIVALHPANGYYELNAYPARSLQKAGAVLLGGSDAPVETRDPQPLVNIAAAVTRRLPGQRALNPAESIGIRDAIEAYTINGAKYLDMDKETGSIETGKSADFVVLDQDILALADGGKADDIARTKVLATYFMGKEVYPQAAR